MTHRSRVIIALVSVVGVALGGTALATPPTGFTTNVLAKGTVADLHATHDGIRVNSRHGVPADVAVATVTIDPGGSSGWHHHPGIVLVVVRSGTVTFYDKDCRGDVHQAGETFIESSDRPGLAKNTGPKPPSSKPPSSSRRAHRRRHRRRFASTTLSQSGATSPE